MAYQGCTRIKIPLCSVVQKKVRRKKVSKNKLNKSRYSFPSFKKISNFRRMKKFWHRTAFFSDFFLRVVIRLQLLCKIGRSKIIIQKANWGKEKLINYPVQIVKNIILLICKLIHKKKSLTVVKS